MRPLFVWFVVLAAAAFFQADLYAQENASAGTAKALSGYSVQLIPFKTAADAEYWIRELTWRGYKPYLYKGVDTQGQQWFAVRIGDYAGAEQAEKALAEFKRAEKLAAFVTRRDSMFPAADNGAALRLAQAESVSAASPQTAAGLSALQQQLADLQQKIADLEKESEARKILQMTAEEERRKEAEILTAAGREYTLIPQNSLGFEYDLLYDYFSSDVLEILRTKVGVGEEEQEVQYLAAERRASHTFTNQLFTEYGLLSNMSMNFILPFVYKYDKISSDDKREVTDLGDIVAGLQYQPFKAGDVLPSIIIVLNGIFPTGRSPYKIIPSQDLSTGNGYYAAGGGLTFSKTLDPAVAYGSVNYTHPFPTTDTDQIQSNGQMLTRVEAGDSLSLSLGMGFALSYKTSLNLAYQYAYHFQSHYYFTDETSLDSSDWVTSSFSVGAGWRLSPRFSLYTKVDIGLTNDDPDFTFSIRIPVRFNLGD